MGKLVITCSKCKRELIHVFDITKPHYKKELICICGNSIYYERWNLGNIDFSKVRGKMLMDEIIRLHNEGLTYNQIHEYFLKEYNRNLSSATITKAFKKIKLSNKEVNKK